MPVQTPRTTPFVGPSRYVPDARAAFAALREAAEVYPAAVAESGMAWMRRKPYDPDAGHPHFFNTMYAALNAIQAMRLQPNALVVEVGAGPGWMTQILVGLGYRVVAIEPSAAMNDLARERIHAFAAMSGAPAEAARFVTATLEEADLTGLLGQVDAVMFHEALHHVIDEHVAMRRVFALLRPGGCVGICGEGRWTPGDRTLEAELDAEMSRYGTLESPFTQSYLHHVLRDAGFADIVFHHSINGLFPEGQENKTVRQVANPSIAAANTVIAWRPLPEDALRAPRPDQAPDRTTGAIEIIAAHWDGAELHARVRLRNTGQTYWPVHRPPAAGGVTLALQGVGDADPAPEAANRCLLPQPVQPGEAIVIEWRFDAAALDRAACRLRLIAEDLFWFPGGTPVPPPAR